jgi:predicted AlkP superfamily pyrophosphatase or phosphodiesterase
MRAARRRLSLAPGKLAGMIRAAALPALCLALLLAGLLPGCTTRRVADARVPEAAPTVVVLSFDGLPAAAVADGSMPALGALARAGVRADGMVPSYPTLTFPNHYTLATGLRPDRHGIVHNYMRDPAFGPYHSKTNGIEARWYGGEPIWATLQRQAGRAGTVAWIGGQDPADPRRPALFTVFDAAQTDQARIDQLLSWLSLPPAQRPRLLMAYFERHDVAAHAHGPASVEAIEARQALDAALQRLREGLQARGLAGQTDVIVVSDHGMAEVQPKNVDVLSAAAPRDAYTVDGVSIVLGVHPLPGREQEVEAALLGRHAHHTCHRRDALPAHWHYGAHPRVAPIVCQADTGWYLYAAPPARKPTRVRGEHGYDPRDPAMLAVFAAAGPSFRSGARIGAFDNVDIYPLLAHLLRIRPAANDGDLAPLRRALRTTAEP